jgi:mannose-6-phosphate isomerase-like protein (cupin superfamily)
MNKTTPKRLTNDTFFSSDHGLRIYHQALSAPFELHWHEFYELTYIISGEGLNVVNGTPCPLAKGSLFLLTPADFHEICPVNGMPLELYNVIFSEELLDERLHEMLFRETFLPMAALESDEASIIQSEFQRRDNIVKPVCAAFPVSGVLMPWRCSSHIRILADKMA